jgi:hypothetical protein
MRAGRWARSGALAIGLAAIGCHPQAAPETDAPTSPVAPVIASSPRRSTTPAPVGVARSPIDLLPEKTGVAVTLASPIHLLPVIDRRG